MKRAGLLLAVFLAALGARAQTATFIETDTTTTYAQASSVYGSDGNLVAMQPAMLPSYVAAPINVSSPTWLWNYSSSPVLNINNLPCWYTNGTITIPVQITDGQTHRIAVYVTDDDNNGRTEVVAIASAAGKILSSQNVSHFNTGQFDVWDVSGSVSIVIVYQTGVNAVATGVFFSTPGGTVPPSSSTTTSPTSCPAPSVALGWPTVTSAIYNVYRMLGTGTPTTKIATGLTVATYTDTTVSSGTTYTYSVTNVVNGVESAQTQVVVVIP